MASLQSFHQITAKSRQIQSQVQQLERISGTRAKKFNAAMQQYRTYIRKQNDLLDRNFKHCEQRNKWYREEVDLSWKNAIANRHIVLRSVARTNVLKKDLDQWLERVDPNALNQNQSEVSKSMMQEEHLEGSQLIDKYNEILLEYGHRI